MAYKYTQIRLRSTDGREFPIDKKLALESTTIRQMLGKFAADDADTSNVTISLSNVHSTVLRKVIDWLIHHRGDNKAASAKDDDSKQFDRSEEIGAWDKKFFKIDTSKVFDIIAVAKYLEIKHLLELGCRTVADLMMGKTADEIRHTFNIKNDFTPAEEERVRQMNEWLEEI